MWPEDATAWLQFERRGDTEIMTEVFQGVSNVTKYKLDKEADYSWPGLTFKYYFINYMNKTIPK